MKKTSIVSLIIIFIALIFAGAPYYMGISARQYVDHAIRFINVDSPLINIKIDDYKRGWLKSEADISVHFTGTSRHSGRAYPIHFSFHETIHHGPIFFHKGFQLGRAYFETSFQMSEGTLSTAQKKVSFDPQIPIIFSQMLLNFSGELKGGLTLDAFKMISKRHDSRELHWGGLESDVFLSSDFTHLLGGIELKDIKIFSEGSKWLIQPLIFSYDLKRHLDNLWIGSVNWKQKQIEWIKADKSLFKLDSVNLSTSSDLKNDLLNTHFIFDMGKVTLPQESYGPFYFKLAINHLNAKVLNDLQNTVRQAAQSSLSDDQRKIMMMSLLPSVSTLISDLSECVLDLRAKLPQGQVNAKGFIRIDGAGQGAPINIMTIRQKLQVNLNAEFPVEIARYFAHMAVLKEMKAEQAKKPIEDPSLAKSDTVNIAMTDLQKANDRANMMLQMWESAGFLKRENDIYTLSFSVQQGRIKLNDKWLN